MNDLYDQSFFPRQKKEINDLYDQSIEELRSISVRLFGGYYEPKSERDYLLGIEITELLAKHLPTKKEVNNE